MRGVLSILLFLAALGCQSSTAPGDLDPNLNSGGTDGALVTDRESYPAGATATFQLKNVYQHALGYNLCTSVLERRSGGGWQAAELGNDRVCTMELRILQPGGTASYNFALDSRLPAGEYRFRTSVENMSSGGRQQLVSNTFRVTR